MGFKKKRHRNENKSAGLVLGAYFFFYPNYFLVAALDSCFFFFLANIMYYKISYSSGEVKFTVGYTFLFLKLKDLKVSWFV